MLAAAFIPHYTIDDITKLAVACSQYLTWQIILELKVVIAETEFCYPQNNDPQSKNQISADAAKNKYLHEYKNSHFFPLQTEYVANLATFKFKLPFISSVFGRIAEFC